MSRSNFDKPFYVDVGTSIVAIRCASNHDVIFEYDYTGCPQVIQFTKETCDRMNKEVELSRPLRNCDVGTAEEQAKKWYWRYHQGHNCHTCPLGPRKWSETDNATLCFSEWLQMPYKEGDEKNGE